MNDEKKNNPEDSQRYTRFQLPTDLSDEEYEAFIRDLLSDPVQFRNDKDETRTKNGDEQESDDS